MSELTDLCEQALAAVGSRAEAVVAASVGRESLTRFARSAIHQNHDEEVRHLRVYAVVDGAGAAATTTSTDADAVKAAADRAVEAARLRRPDPHWPGVAGPTPLADVDHFDDATAGASPDLRAEVVRAFVAAGEGLEAAGYCSTSVTHRALATSGGQVVEGRRTLARVRGIARTGRADGSAQQAASRLADLDGAALGAEAAGRARAADEATDIEPGTYEVLLEPSCVGNLMSFFSNYGWNAKSHADGTSFVHLGERQMDEALSIADDVGHPRSTGLAFDGEATPTRRVELVRAGESVGLVHDRRSATLAGVESTGHFSGSVAFGPIPSNVVVSPGSSSRDDLVASIERGLVVTDLWYVRVLDPKTMVCTGLTRNGVFLVEKGEVVRAVANLRFTQSYAGALAPGRVLGVGDTLHLASGEDAGVYAAPALRLAAWSFTGGAQG